MGQTTTYLSMCQSVRQYCGVSGTGPLTVEDQTGILKEIVDWVRDAWKEIQLSRFDWLFKWASFPDTFRTSVGTREYLTEIGDFREWGTAEKDMKITTYLVSDGQNAEYELTQWDYQDFRNHYMTGETASVQGKPRAYAITPENELALGPIPDGTYRLRGQYYKDIQVLSSGDTIELDDRYVDVIKWLGVVYFGMAYESPNKYQMADQKYRQAYTRLVNEQTPVVEYGIPLA